MSKYSIEDTTLTAIADAIREKGGTSDPILTEGMAAAIAAIEAGGGCAIGTIIPADTSIDALEIDHNLGAIPEFVMLCASSNTNGVYTQSRPEGFSFIYAIKDKYSVFNWFSRYMYGNNIDYSTGKIESEFSVGLGYEIAISETKMYIRNSNSTNGFGATPAPLMWVAIKEVPV